jgi:hypothetical protein
MENLKLILENGADVNVIDNHQKIPFIAAVSASNWEAAYLILVAGTNIHYENKWGETPKVIVEAAGLGAKNKWRKKVFDYFANNGVVLNPRVPL